MYPTGVAIVTTACDDGGPAGMTINSFSSISMEPALIGWCIDRSAASYPIFSRCSAFTISVLGQDQQQLASIFATANADKFGAIASAPVDNDATSAGPVIPGASAWLRCQLYRQVPLGDHLMLVGEVTDFVRYSVQPLVFAQGQFGQLNINSPAVENTTAQPAAATA